MREVPTELAESLARKTSRRFFLSRAMGWSFVTVAGLAGGGSLAEIAKAHTANGQDYCANRTPGVYGCTGSFCTGCNGHDCPSGYWFWTGAHASACWCKGAIGGHYFICCDCTNGSNVCVCTDCVGNCTSPGGRKQ